VGGAAAAGVYRRCAGGRGFYTLHTRADINVDAAYAAGAGADGWHGSGAGIHAGGERPWRCAAGGCGQYDDCDCVLTGGLGRWLRCRKPWPAVAVDKANQGSGSSCRWVLDNRR